MGILFAFFAGWMTCARGGQTSDEVLDALKAVRDSDEVADLVTAMRHHAGHSLQNLGAALLDSADSRPGSVIDLVARVRALVQPAGPTSTGT
ncbi:hypothetical protein [Sporichthya sp.]|uniref:hypothetical protein n=1 Tax=Sporichthya sp. TaxID=65475 RepID=UPI0018300674|nr:hypothetical protein [Sporichthya sp.]MBA3741336.1 hypothetical protein [Sporichthya sp.]